MDEKKKKTKKFSVARTLTIGFLLIALLGAVLLSLPISLLEDVNLPISDALFISTSALCVTGLTTVDITSTFSTFGRFILIVLIQVGGLGFMTFVTLIYFLINKKISLKDEMLIEEDSSSMITYSNTFKILSGIVKFTLIAEALGALLLFLAFMKQYNIADAICKSLFISISAFCNAGFDTIGVSSLCPFQSNYWINIIVILLIHIGGLGFFVILDIYTKFKEGIKKGLKFTNICKRLSVHSKIVITTNLALTFFGAFAILILESMNPLTMNNQNFIGRFIISLFQSVAARSAGFVTINLNQTLESTKFVYMMLMLIGGSPTGTAGGIKTTTVALLILTVISTFKNQSKTTAFGKTIPSDNIRKAMVLFFSGVFYIAVTSLILITFENCSITVGTFEVISAFSTVGSTLGFTQQLSIFGKFIIMLTMFIGRVGILNLAASLMFRSSNKSQDLITYSEEKVLL